jgi:hypothetical protein
VSIDWYFKLLAGFLAGLLGRTDRDNALYDPMIDQVKLIEKHIKTEGGKPPQTGNKTMANVRRRYADPEANEDAEDPPRRTPRAT